MTAHVICGIDTRTAGKFLAPLRSACEQMRVGRFISMTPHIDWQHLTEASILVCHVFDADDQVDDQWSDLQARASAGAILIRVTTEPRDAPRPATSHGKYLLHLCWSTRDMKLENWTEVLHGLCNGVGFLGDFINGRGDGALDKYFICGKVDHLLVLAIRCQCYLAAYAEQTGSTWGPPAISEALSKMEWDEFMNRGRAATEQISTTLLKRRKELQQDVRGRDWWNLFGNQDPFDVCRREWGQDLIGWDEIGHLLRLVAARDDIPEPGISEHPVALAFLSLHRRLRKRRRS